MIRATTWDTPYVHLECACGKEWGIEDLYYCYQCSKVVCPYCVNEEIDSFYCRTCMENMPATEANAFKSKCSRCFQCPICFSTLQLQHYNYRGQKFYHFGCYSCFWDSMNFDLKGNSLNELFVSNKEMYSKDTVLNDKFKILQETYKEAYRIRRRTTMRHPTVKESWTLEDLEKSQRTKEISQQMTKSKNESLSLDQLLDENLVYCEISSIPQRLLNISTQPREISKCLLQPVQLLTKRCKRCKTCNKYVLKPETNPTSSNFFKMENLLVNIFPKIMIREIRTSELILVLINPTPNLAYVKFEGIRTPNDEVHLNAYDNVMDICTHEGGNDGYERDKNSLVISVGRDGVDLRLKVNWRFMRGTDMKNIVGNLHIKLAK